MGVLNFTYIGVIATFFPLCKAMYRDYDSFGSMEDMFVVKVLSKNVRSGFVEKYD